MLLLLSALQCLVYLNHVGFDRFHRRHHPHLLLSSKPEILPPVFPVSLEFQSQLSIL